MALYRTDIWIAATAYVQADSAEEAAEMVNTLDMCGFDLDEQMLDLDGVEISGKRFDDPDLPELSLSPAVSVYTRNMRGQMFDQPKIAADDMEEAA